jgi:hypothetical protein
MSDTLNAVMAQYESSTQKNQKGNKVSNEERLKLYFATNLAKGKEVGSKKFRILPPKSGESPFKELYYHEMKLGDKWVKLHCLRKNDKERCPLCEVRDELLKTGKKEDKDIAQSYNPRKFYITKGIDRDREEDGPKFWRFRHSFKKTGNLDKIVPLFTAKGDITDPNKGRDIIISVGRDDSGYSKVTSIMLEDQGPLSEDKDQAQEWINNPLTPADVYSKKTFEYLNIVALGSEPYWDKDTEKYITKEEWEEKNKTDVEVTTIDDDGEAEVRIGGNKKPVVEEEQKPVAKTEVKPTSKIKVTTKTKPVEVVNENTEESDNVLDDLPF